MITPKFAVLLSRKIGSGKNTFAEMLAKELGDKAYLDSFARPLKEMCRDAFAPLARYLNQYLPDGEKLTEESFFENKVTTSRILLQAVGTDIVRKVNDQYWIRKLCLDAHHRPEPIVIITDWRFPGEAEIPFHTFRIRINRRKEEITKADLHVSETALDSYTGFNFVIDNNGDLDSLRNAAQQLAYHFIEETME